jgi:endoglucanase
LACLLGGHLLSAVAASELTFERGINLSGAELNPDRKPAVYGRDYIYPSQPSLFGNLDEVELGRINTVIAAAHKRNMRVILSPHNFGRYYLDGNERLICTDGVSIEAFADFSRKVAAAFAGNQAVYGLSLMNEPHASRCLWKQTAQAGLDAIRAADRERLVLAPGDEWSGAWS